MKMVTLARAFLTLLLVVAAAIYLPDFYWKAFDVNIIPPRVSYSPVAEKFLLVRADARQVTRTDPAGRTYTRDEYELLLPLTSYRQLMTAGTLPDSLDGVWLSPRLLSLNDFSLYRSPLFYEIPQIQLFPLFESESGRASLEMPPEFFRLGERMEFIDCVTNRVNQDLSRVFMDSLRACGFNFPAESIWGNPSILKPFDEGYFATDAQNKLFHIKMARGKPFCRSTGVPPAFRIKTLLVQEMNLREFYGLVVSENDSLYFLSYDGYRLIPLPVTGYDSHTMDLAIRGDLFYRTISLTSPTGIRTVVTDRKYQVIDTFEETWKSKHERTPGVVAQFLFPFVIELSDNGMTYVNADLRVSGPSCLLAIGLCLAVMLLILKHRKHVIASYWFDLLVVALTGVFGFVAVNLVKKET